MNKNSRAAAVLGLAIQYYTSPADAATNTHCTLPYNGGNLKLQFLQQTSDLYHLMGSEFCTWVDAEEGEIPSPSPNQALGEFVRWKRRKEQKEKQRPQSCRGGTSMVYWHHLYQWVLVYLHLTSRLRSTPEFPAVKWDQTFPGGKYSPAVVVLYMKRTIPFCDPQVTMRLGFDSLPTIHYQLFTQFLSPNSPRNAP